jgi:HEAT repeat protein
MGYSGWDEKREMQGMGILWDWDQVSGEDLLPERVKTKPYVKADMDYALGYWEKGGWDQDWAEKAPEQGAPPEVDRDFRMESSHAASRLEAALRYEGLTRMSEILAVAGSWGGHQGIRYEAKGLLWDNAKPENLPLYLALLNPHDFMAFQELLEVFVILGESGVRALQDALPKLEEKDRARALYVLADLRAASALEPVMAAMKDPSWRVRREAARALAKILDSSYIKGLESLRKAVEQSGKDQVRQWLGKEKKVDMLAALWGAGLARERWHDFFGGLATDFPEPEAAGAAQTLFLEKKEALTAWLESRILALKAVEAQASRMAGFLQDTDRDARRWLVVGLGHSAPQELCDRAEALLSDPDYTVRTAAVRGLRELGPSRCPALKTLARKSPNARPRALAAKALAR